MMRPCKLQQQVTSSIGMFGVHQIANSAEPRQDVFHILGEDKRYFGNRKIIHIEESLIQSIAFSAVARGGQRRGCQTR